ncbi:MAG: CdaR family protein [Desulforhopalus sp.]|nr:CdaR family protein [Desulforhopalus sp.]
MKEILAKLFEPKKLTRLMSKDWLLKFISLVLAIVLWYFVGGEDRINKNVMVPIEIINLPRDLVISNQYKKEIEVTVSGPRSLIMEMASRAITRQVDLSAATPGTMVIENDNKHIPVIRGVTVQRVQPSSMILSLDKLVQKQFPVEARTVGRVANGYQIKSLKTDPELITIAGPHTILSQVDRFFTKAINLDGVKQSMQLQVPLDLDPAIVELIGETSVTTDLVIGLETVTITFEGLRVNTLPELQNIEIQPSQVKVVAHVPKVILDRKIDLKTLLSAVAVKRDGDAAMKVRIVPRADLDVPVEIVTVDPDVVRMIGGNGAVTGQNLPEPVKTTVGEGKKAADSQWSQVKIIETKNEEKAPVNKTSPIKIKKTATKVKY